MVIEPSSATSYGGQQPELRKPSSASVQPINAKIESQLPVTKQQPTNKVEKQPSIESTNIENTKKTLQGAEEEEKTDALSPEELGELLDEINNTLYSMNKSLKFEVSDKTDDLIVRVINTDTDQVIRQYPSEEVLKRKEQLLEGETTAFNARVD